MHAAHRMVLQPEGIMTIDVNTKTIGEVAMELQGAIAKPLAEFAIRLEQRSGG
ncbi:MAG: hypothetical protein ACXW2P_05775 [Thermoanaerobaculia bacterium]